jgi:hypothetical protein
LTVLNHGAELTVPLSACLTETTPGEWIPDFSIGAENASSAIPVESGGTVALVGSVIPLFAAAADLPSNAGGAIPSLAIGTDAHLIILVVYPATRAVLLSLAEVAIPNEVVIT